MLTRQLDLSDPTWFLDGLDWVRGEARLIKTDRESLSREAFLDDRWDRSALPHVNVPIDQIGRPLGARPRLNFIWHTSFCCSTLVAALLDAPGKNLSLKEPRVLVELASLKRRQRESRAVAALTPVVLGLYARRFDPAEQILIKASNFANNLIVETAAASDGRCLMLYSSCRSFLVSIVKEREARRGYARQLFLSLAEDGHLQSKWPIDALLRLTDLEMAAVAWQMQMSAMQNAMQVLGDRAASMDGDRFLQDPMEGLAALDSFFAVGLGAEAIGEILSGPRLGRSVKTGKSGEGRLRRQADAARVEQELGAELNRLVGWATNGADGVPSELPRSLT